MEIWETACGLLVAVRWERRDKSAALVVRVPEFKVAKVGFSSEFRNGQTQTGSAAHRARISA